jgi:hypothetical protein
MIFFVHLIYQTHGCIEMCKLLLTKQKWVKTHFFFYSKGNLMVSANKIEILRIARNSGTRKND